MSSTVNIHVVLVDNVTTLQIPIEKSTTGEQLLAAVSSTLGGIPEIQFFGLQYTEVQKGEAQVKWLKPTDKVWSKLGVKKSMTETKVPLRIKFYPEDATRELRPEGVALKLLYLQVKEAIRVNKFECPFGVRQELESIEERCTVQIIGNTTSADPTSSHDINAMLTYLQTAQSLPSYGITYFEGKDKTLNPIRLGIQASGISIHNPQQEHSQIPSSKLEWSAIRNMNFADKKFTIALVDTKTPVVLYLRLRDSKEILKLAMGNHQLYMARHKY